MGKNLKPSVSYVIKVHSTHPVTIAEISNSTSDAISKPPFLNSNEKATGNLSVDGRTVSTSARTSKNIKATSDVNHEHDQQKSRIKTFRTQLFRRSSHKGLPNRKTDSKTRSSSGQAGVSYPHKTTRATNEPTAQRSVRRALPFERVERHNLKTNSKKTDKNSPPIRVIDEARNNMRLTAGRNGSNPRSSQRRNSDDPADDSSDVRPHDESLPFGYIAIERLEGSMFKDEAEGSPASSVDCDEYNVSGQQNKNRTPPTKESAKQDGIQERQESLESTEISKWPNLGEDPLPERVELPHAEFIKKWLPEADAKSRESLSGRSYLSDTEGYDSSIKEELKNMEDESHTWSLDSYYDDFPDVQYDAKKQKIIMAKDPGMGTRVDIFQKSDSHRILEQRHASERRHALDLCQAIEERQALERLLAQEECQTSQGHQALNKSQDLDVIPVLETEQAKKSEVANAQETWTSERQPRNFLPRDDSEILSTSSRVTLRRSRRTDAEYEAKGAEEEHGLKTSSSRTAPQKGALMKRDAKRTKSHQPQDEDYDADNEDFASEVGTVSETTSKHQAVLTEILEHLHETQEVLDQFEQSLKSKTRVMSEESQNETGMRQIVALIESRGNEEGLVRGKIRIAHASCPKGAPAQPANHETPSMGTTKSARQSLREFAEKTALPQQFRLETRSEHPAVKMASTMVESLPHKCSRSVSGSPPRQSAASETCREETGALKEQDTIMHKIRRMCTSGPKTAQRKEDCPPSTTILSAIKEGVLQSFLGARPTDQEKLTVNDPEPPPQPRRHVVDSKFVNISSEEGKESRPTGEQRLQLSVLPEEIDSVSSTGATRASTNGQGLSTSKEESKTGDISAMRPATRGQIQIPMNEISGKADSISSTGATRASTNGQGLSTSREKSKTGDIGAMRPATRGQIQISMNEISGEAHSISSTGATRASTDGQGLSTSREKSKTGDISAMRPTRGRIQISMHEISGEADSISSTGATRASTNGQRFSTSREGSKTGGISTVSSVKPREIQTSINVTHPEEASRSSSTRATWGSTRKRTPSILTDDLSLEKRLSNKGAVPTSTSRRISKASSTGATKATSREMSFFSGIESMTSKGSACSSVLEPEWKEMDRMLPEIPAHAKVAHQSVECESRPKRGTDNLQTMTRIPRPEKDSEQRSVSKQSSVTEVAPESPARLPEEEVSNPFLIPRSQVGFKSKPTLSISTKSPEKSRDERKLLKMQKCKEACETYSFNSATDSGSRSIHLKIPLENSIGEARTPNRRQFSKNLSGEKKNGSQRTSRRSLHNVGEMLDRSHLSRSSLEFHRNVSKNSSKFEIGQPSSSSFKTRIQRAISIGKNEEEERDSKTGLSQTSARARTSYPNFTHLHQSTTSSSELLPIPKVNSSVLSLQPSTVDGHMIRALAESKIYHQGRPISSRTIAQSLSSGAIAHDQQNVLHTPPHSNVRSVFPAGAMAATSQAQPIYGTRIHGVNPRQFYPNFNRAGHANDRCQPWVTHERPTRDVSLPRLFSNVDVPRREYNGSQPWSTYERPTRDVCPPPNFNVPINHQYGRSQQRSMYERPTRDVCLPQPRPNFNIPQDYHDSQLWAAYKRPVRDVRPSGPYPNFNLSRHKYDGGRPRFLYERPARRISLPDPRLNFNTPRHMFDGSQPWSNRHVHSSSVTKMVQNKRSLHHPVHPDDSEEENSRRHLSAILSGNFDGRDNIPYQPSYKGSARDGIFTQSATNFHSPAREGTLFPSSPNYDPLAQRDQVLHSSETADRATVDIPERDYFSRKSCPNFQRRAEEDCCFQPAATQNVPIELLNGSSRNVQNIGTENEALQFQPCEDGLVDPDGYILPWPVPRDEQIDAHGYTLPRQTGQEERVGITEYVSPQSTLQDGSANTGGYGLPQSASQDGPIDVDGYLCLRPVPPRHWSNCVNEYDDVHRSVLQDDSGNVQGYLPLQVDPEGGPIDVDGYLCPRPAPSRCRSAHTEGYLLPQSKFDEQTKNPLEGAQTSHTRQRPFTVLETSIQEHTYDSISEHSYESIPATNEIQEHKYSPLIEPRTEFCTSCYDSDESPPQKFIKEEWTSASSGSQGSFTGLDDHASQHGVFSSTPYPKSRREGSTISLSSSSSYGRITEGKEIITINDTLPSKPSSSENSYLEKTAYDPRDSRRLPGKSAVGTQGNVPDLIQFSDKDSSQANTRDLIEFSNKESPQENVRDLIEFSDKGSPQTDVKDLIEFSDKESPSSNVRDLIEFSDKESPQTAHKACTVKIIDIDLSPNEDPRIKIIETTTALDPSLGLAQIALQHSDEAQDESKSALSTPTVSTIPVENENDRLESDDTLHHDEDKSGQKSTKLKECSRICLANKVQNSNKHQLMEDFNRDPHFLALSYHILGSKVTKKPMSKWTKADLEQLAEELMKEFSEVEGSFVNPLQLLQEELRRKEADQDGT